MTPAPTSAGTAGVFAIAHGDWYPSYVALDGTYAIAGLPAGSYTVEFHSVGYVTEYYNDVLASGSATTVPVSLGVTTSGINATLTAGSTSVSNPAAVTGRVVDLDGNGLGGVTVLAKTAGVETTTAPDGTYSLTVTTGDSSLLLTRDGYVTETVGIFPPSSNTVANPFVATTLTAADGTYSVTNLREGYYAVSAESINDAAYASIFPGAISLAYAPVAADVGQALTVVVTATQDGYPPVSSSDTSAPVQKGVMARGTVSISGTADLGSRISVRVTGVRQGPPGTWSPGNVRLSYQWRRDGVAISGATRTGYTVTLADVGHVVSVSVTGTRYGYIPATAVSAPTAVVTQPRVVAGTVLLMGTPTVSSTLFAQAGGWDPNNVTLTYQWLRDGVPIPAANRRTCTVTRADVGHALTVTVTGAAPGYLPTTVTSVRTVLARR